MLGQDLDVLLHRLDALVARLPEPATQALERPDVAEARLLLQDLVRLGDDLERSRREQPFAGLPFDHDVHGVGAGQLLVDALRRAQRLLAVRHLVGQAIARLELQIGPAAHDERDERHQRGRHRPMHHAIDDPADQPAEPIHQPVGGSLVPGELALLAHQEQPQQRQHQDHRNERDADGQASRHAERADQPRLRHQQRQERQQRGAVRQHAGGPHHAHGEAHGLGFAVALAQANADRRHHLHAVGKAHHHDERRHDVEEQIEANAEPAEQPQRPQHRQHRRQGGEQHQRHALEEDHGNGGAEQQPQAVVDDLVALHGVAYLELHDRRARQVRLEPDRRQLLLQVAGDAADHLLGAFGLHHLAVERDHGQRQLAVGRQELALDDVV